MCIRYASYQNKGGGNYAIQCDFVDDYYYTPDPNRIPGSYEGKLAYIDDSQTEEQSMASAKARKEMVVKQQIKCRFKKTVRPVRFAARR